MSIINTVAEFVTTVTALAEDKVIVGRANYKNVNFNDNIAIVDSLISTPVGRSNGFDGDTEQLTYTVKNKASFTIDFYGINAETNAIKFIARLNSQEAYEFKRDNDIEVFHNTTMTNVKDIQGKTVYNRFQVEIMVKYTEEFIDEVLRIDTAEYTIITDN